MTSKFAPQCLGRLDDQRIWVAHLQHRSDRDVHPSYNGQEARHFLCYYSSMRTISVSRKRPSSSGDEFGFSLRVERRERTDDQHRWHQFWPIGEYAAEERSPSLAPKRFDRIKTGISCLEDLDGTETAMKLSSPAVHIPSRDVDAVLFDLDGVVTQMVKLHAAAWKDLFDGYLRQRAALEHKAFQPFDADTDYRHYIDGKPRYAGVESFLKSRGLELPYGDPSNTPERETVCGLGNRQDDIFLKRLKTEGVEVFDSTVALIHTLKARGIKTAIVSSSQHCAAVLDAAGLAGLFTARVDGVDIARLKLKGKPDPDIFLKAAERLGVAPARTIVVEDAIPGVQAGRNGKFKLIIGVARQGDHGILQENGADVVVGDLREIDFDGDSAVPIRNAMDLPSALDGWKEIARRMQNMRIVTFCDYDGTLTPIVDRPDRAQLSEEMRRTVGELANRCPVAIISGRDRADVQRLVQIDTIVYAGSHGFDIVGPHGMQLQYEQGTDLLPIIDHAEDELRQKLARVQGVLVERKKFSIAIHVRGVAQADEGAVETIVDDVLAHHPELRKEYGKKVFDLQPRVDWHKGRAVIWVLRALGLDRSDVLPLYVGDDLTDENAFKALVGRGIGIVVAESSRPTAASYVLKNPHEVCLFLRRLIVWLER
jgi:trehalose-phosphatase